MKKLSLLIALMVTLTVHAEPSSKPSIFVAPLDGDVSAIMGWQPALGEGLAEMLITELTKLNKFDVLESTALPELINEIHLGEAGYVAEGEKVDKGGFAGADFCARVRLAGGLRLWRDFAARSISDRSAGRHQFARFAAAKISRCRAGAVGDSEWRS